MFLSAIIIKNHKEPFHVHPQLSLTEYFFMVKSLYSLPYVFIGSLHDM